MAIWNDTAVSTMVGGLVGVGVPFLLGVAGKEIQYLRLRCKTVSALIKLYEDAKPLSDGLAKAVGEVSKSHARFKEEELEIRTVVNIAESIRQDVFLTQSADERDKYLRVHITLCRLRDTLSDLLKDRAVVFDGTDIETIDRRLNAPRQLLRDPIDGKNPRISPKVLVNLPS